MGAEPWSLVGRCEDGLDAWQPGSRASRTTWDPLAGQQCSVNSSHPPSTPPAPYRAPSWRVQLDQERCQRQPCTRVLPRPLSHLTPTSSLP